MGFIFNVTSSKFNSREVNILDLLSEKIIVLILKFIIRNIFHHKDMPHVVVNSYSTFIVSLANLIKKVYDDK